MYECRCALVKYLGHVDGHMPAATTDVNDLALVEALPRILVAKLRNLSVHCPPVSWRAVVLQKGPYSVKPQP